MSSTTPAGTNGGPGGPAGGKVEDPTDAASQGKALVPDTPAGSDTATPRAYPFRIVRYGRADPNTLHPHPRNWRTHGKAQEESLDNLMRRVGWLQNVVVNTRTDFMLDGHDRVKLAIASGEPDVPITYVDVEPEREDEVLALFDPIGELAGRHQTMFDQVAQRAVAAAEGPMPAALRNLLQRYASRPLFAGDDQVAEEGTAPEDLIARAEQLRQKWQTAPGQTWRVPSATASGNHWLVCGSAAEAETWTRMLADVAAPPRGSVQMLWTDPPYGVNYVGKTSDALRIQNDALDDNALRALLDATFGHADNAMAPGAPFYIAAPANPLAGIFREAIAARGWLFHQPLVWVKQTLVLGHSDYHYQHEEVLYGWKRGTGHAWYADRTRTTVFDHEPDVGSMTLEEAREYIRILREALGTSVHREDRPMASREHPTMKPPRLIRRHLEASSLPGARVCDPFAGSGSTGVACEQTGRLNLASEIDPRYLAVNLERLELLGLAPVLETNP